MVIINMAMKQGNRIVRDMVDRKLMSKYRLAREMGVSDNAVDMWYDGKFFNDARLPRLIDVREKWLKIREMGIYSK